MIEYKCNHCSKVFAGDDFKRYGYIRRRLGPISVCIEAGWVVNGQYQALGDSEKNHLCEDCIMKAVLEGVPE